MVALVIFIQGCSIFAAAHAPAPLNLENLKPGMSRGAVISVLGSPLSSETIGGQRTDVFEFRDGYQLWTKSRIILYGAGDFFTLGLAELILWPLELMVFQGTEGRAVVTYASDEKASQLQLTHLDGAPWGGDDPQPTTRQEQPGSTLSRYR